MAKDKSAPLKEYEVLERIDFGDSGENDERDFKGVHEPSAEGEDPKVISLPEDIAAPAVEAGAIKPAGEEAPVGFNHDNPEELGYQGDQAKEAEQKSSSGSASAASKSE
jgi:hypothetical protein